jgi:hypothetical protein
MTRLKLAELTCGIGALALGVGLGAAGFIAVAGVAAHGFGMWDKHRLEAQAHVESAPWIVALYWVCWLLLAAVVVLLLVRR